MMLTVDCKLLLVWHVTSITALPVHAFTEATLKYFHVQKHGHNAAQL